MSPNLYVTYAVLSAAVLLLTCHGMYDAHAQADDLVARWMVEGQYTSEDATDASTVVMPENIYPENQVSDSQSPFKYDYFVTGNRYSVGDYEITIFSAEGQALNQAIIEQRDLQQDSFRHKIKYHDRFSDGYVELAEALLEPLGEQTYFIGGSTYDHNPNSNLEIFVLERGYSLDNLQAVPNYIFSPMEFTFGRALLDQAGQTGDGAGDLRDYSPNYMVLDKDQLYAQMTESLSVQTSEMHGGLFFAPERAEPEPELYMLNSRPDRATEPVLPPSDPMQGAFDQMQDDFPLYPPRFEGSGSLNAAVNRDFGALPRQDAPLQDYNTDYLTILLATSVAAGLACLVLWRAQQARPAHRGRQPVLVAHGNAAVASEPDRVHSAKTLLSDARRLHDAKRYKDAHEALGRAIRLYYSHRLHVKYVMTNAELLARVQQKNAHDLPNEYELVRAWLSVCGSVEYAKHSPDKKRFLHALAEFSDMIDGA